MDDDVFNRIVTGSIRHVVGYKRAVRLNLVSKNQFEFCANQVLEDCSQKHRAEVLLLTGFGLLQEISDR